MLLRRAVRIALVLAGLSFAAIQADPSSAPTRVLVRDIASVEGVRSNPLLGYGIVVGLNGTGDRRQTVFTTQTLAGVLSRLGVQIPAAAVRVNNVASVFVTATLPPFARPGTALDVTVSSIGDAKSLEGGILLLTPLRAADGEVYAAAQGPLTVGGYSAGGAGNGKQVNHPTVGRIPSGGLVERDAAPDLHSLAKVAWLLADESFSTADALAAAVNQEFGTTLASVVDSRRVEVLIPADGKTTLPALIARIEKLQVAVEQRARVVINERTGTIVMGREVQLRAVSILHGSLSVEIATQLAVSQPAPLGQGQTVVAPETKLKAEEAPARRVELGEGATVEQLVNGLQAIGASARDVIAILQALKAAGALEADLEVL
jgi:flagellar P-ring protein precursor FlgI